MRIVSWNMNRVARKKEAHAEAWRFLRDELRADLALVQEASPEPHLGPMVYQPIDRRQYNWGSAVVALAPGLRIRGRERPSLAECYLTPPKLGQIPDSHPGASAVADVMDAAGAVLFTAVSLYGQWEVIPGAPDDSTSRLHRMLSDLTTLFVGADRPPVVLAGDLNISTQWVRPEKLAQRVSAAFARITAFGLVDCLAHPKATRPDLPSCPCRIAGCKHVQTVLSQGSVNLDPVQLDYAYVSESLVGALESCNVQRDRASQLSDHFPIVVELNEQNFAGRLTLHAPDGARRS